MHTIDTHSFPQRTDETGSSSSKNWLVMKFGGTNVSSEAQSTTIRDPVRERLAAGFRPVVVHSALATVSATLETMLNAALAGSYQPKLEQAIALHSDLADTLGTDGELILGGFSPSWNSYSKMSEYKKNKR